MNRKRSQMKIDRIMHYAVLVLFACFILLPIVYLIMNSLKPTAVIFTDPWSLPLKPHFSNYSDAWGTGGIGRYTLNSLIVTAVTLTVGTSLSLSAAYGIQRMKWKLSGVVKTFFLIGLMVPVNATLIPLYVVFSKIHLLDSYIGLVLIYTAFQLPVSIVILSAFLSTVPRALEEAAVIDGCSLFGSFVRIVAPMTTPAILTVLIFNFIATWNELLVALVFLNSQTRYTLPVGLTNFSGQYITLWGPLLAATVLAMLPALILYSLFNNRIVSGIAAGAIKM